MWMSSMMYEAQTTGFIILLLFQLIFVLDIGRLHLVTCDAILCWETSNSIFVKYSCSVRHQLVSWLGMRFIHISKPFPSN